MDLWVRIILLLGIYGLIEAVDYYVDAFSSPWWLSLLMAAFCSISDIIVIAMIEVITDDC